MAHSLFDYVAAHMFFHIIWYSKFEFWCYYGFENIFILHIWYFVLNIVPILYSISLLSPGSQRVGIYFL